MKNLISDYAYLLIYTYILKEKLSLQESLFVIFGNLTIFFFVIKWFDLENRNFAERLLIQTYTEFQLISYKFKSSLSYLFIASSGKL